ncbi:MAG: hypothetical protein KME60_15155 [Cyanomargarita calcarea GSE-NOS-MK-12-04C]|uniref:Uncharacterized protein n=1 Tax=Cyanomargarita calcarea GSE-NOS-MK-12-04C TaxID=2839659 RepID=A0A951QMR7_9CYAN|nr:hypothetical protein [Cyanomargarita calcarea GSE-NOS-MK-12-04C]
MANGLLEFNEGRRKKEEGRRKKKQEEGGRSLRAFKPNGSCVPHQIVNWWSVEVVGLNPPPIA